MNIEAKINDSLPTKVATRSADEPTSPTVSRSNHDEGKLMKAVEWQGKKTVAVHERPVPVVTDPNDVILRVTSSCICGSDLHLYVGAMPGMAKGDVLGHEFMGVVEDVGPGVKDIKKGDRVVSSFDIGCGACHYCKKELYTSCETTNPTGGGQEKLWGHHSGGFHGYSHLTGGWEGGQAEYARVPFADLNCLKVPANLTDEQVVLLSDILPTAWHACELAYVGKGDVVAVWGAGPVGILAAQCSMARGAAQVIMIDDHDYRLEFAKAKVPGVQTINFATQKDVKQALHDIVPTGPDVGLECVGFHYAKSLTHKIEMALQIETDPADMLNEMIESVAKGGRLGVVGAYAGYTNHFNIGAFMEKGLSMRAGQTPVQHYWHKLLDMVKNGQLNPSVVITHELPLDKAADGYKMFNDKQDNCIKVVLKPQVKAS
jgi:threonine dehydrogenase-like Zn-dependent dehydrogenase